MLHVVWARAYASVQMANIFFAVSRTTITIWLLISWSCHTPVWRLAAWTSRFLPPFVFYLIFLFSFCGYIAFLFSFCGYIAFVLRSTAIPAVRIPVCTLYSKLTCSCRNFDVSVIYIMLLQHSTGIVIWGMTPALSLRCKFSWRLPNDSWTASLRICTLPHDQPNSVG